MAASKGKGIPVANPFACLKTEEELAEERKARRKLEQQNHESSSNKNDTHKKNKPKKTTEKDRLKQLAFGFATPSSANSEPPKPASAGKKKSGKNRNSNNPITQEKDWQQWKEHDQEVVEDQFREDLEKALLESQLQSEKKKTEDKQKKERVSSANEGTTIQEEDGKKKKKKDKAKTMSLEEFNNLHKPKTQKTSDDSQNDEASRPPIHHRVPSASDKDSKFFNSAQHEAKQIVKKDKMREEYRKTCAADNVVVAQLKNEIEKRDKTIKDLKQKMEKTENEMKQVKQRNKQLCVILAQGEMKDKAQVLLQVDELNNVKDELMEQVTSLTAELEKEKSKNRSLKPEAKAGKHGK